ncbi:hypothetical protein Pth03_31780 [Planotetraspora thailandica]|uniref:General stress protein 17M-like domain-containing protein n=2 Tax=Planotetraspora thailandica TaxID=487172 RepID=A0A8J3UZ63_9ACTN|nr:hypothetical protein Pth03_31780 [Planotetraspora thailandica]
MRPLAGFPDYASAQRMVDALSDAGFPVETSAIVGSDLRLEERVTGRLTTGRAALHGLESGAVIGLFIGLFLGLFTATTISFIGIVIWSVIWAAIVGAIFGAVTHAMQKGARDFSSRSAIVAGRYDVLVAAQMLEQAKAVLASSGAVPGGPGQPGTTHTGWGQPGTTHGGPAQPGPMHTEPGGSGPMHGRPMQGPDHNRGDTGREPAPDFRPNHPQ